MRLKNNSWDNFWDFFWDETDVDRGELTLAPNHDPNHGHNPGPNPGPNTCGPNPGPKNQTTLQRSTKVPPGVCKVAVEEVYMYM